MMETLITRISSDFKSFTFWYKEQYVNNVKFDCIIDCITFYNVCAGLSASPKTIGESHHT